MLHSLGLGNIKICDDGISLSWSVAYSSRIQGTAASSVFVFLTLAEFTVTPNISLTDDALAGLVATITGSFDKSVNDMDPKLFAEKLSKAVGVELQKMLDESEFNLPVTPIEERLGAPGKLI